MLVVFSDWFRLGISRSAQKAFLAEGVGLGEARQREKSPSVTSKICYSHVGDRSFWAQGLNILV